MNNASVILDTSTASSIEDYINSAYQVPQLTANEEYDLATQLQKNENIDAAQKLVLSHLKFVIHTARGFAGYGLPQADLIQEGNVGLMKAVKRFNPEVGVRLVSFAVFWIKAEIQEYVIKNWKLVKVATTKAQRKLFFNLRKNKKSLEWMGRADTKALAEKLSVSEKDVSEMENRMGTLNSSYDLEGVSDGSGNSMTSMPFTKDDSSDHAKQFELENDKKTLTRFVHQSLNQLDERSQDILKSRWMIENTLTLKDLASKYNVSIERIRQIEKNAMKKLKDIIEV